MMTTNQFLRSIAALTALASFATAQFPAGPAEILYINSPGHPTNVVPGTGLPFNAGGTSTSAVIRPWFSQDESQFVIEVFADSPVTTNDDCYLKNGALLMREGDPTPWNPLELWGTLDDDVGLANSGDVLVTQNTSLTTNDDIVARFTAGVWSELAREGGLVDPFVPSLAGALWDDGMDTPRLAGGQSLWHSDLVDFVPAITIGDEFSLLPSGGIVREGFDIPAGQAGGGTFRWENFTVGETYVNDSGSVMLVLGDTDNPATADDQILAVNGVVVLQENQIIAGSSFVNPIDLSGIVQAWLDNADAWWARGNNDVTEDDWVVRNGIVIVTSDGTSEVVPGSGEFFSDATFGDCFFAMDGSVSGAWVIGAVTNNVDPQRDGVIVYDDGLGNRQVLAREGDPIDVNGNGLFDDDRFFNTFGNDDVILLESGHVVFTATVENGLGAAVEHGLFRIKINGATCVRRNGTGINPLTCECTTLPVSGTNLVITVGLDPATVLTFVAVAGAPIPATPLFGGELLVDPLADIFTSTGTHTFSLPPAPALFGQTAYLQGARLDSTGGGTFVLLNAIDVKIGL